MNRRSWRVGVIEKRWRIPVWIQWFHPPTPRWLRIWYFRKSYQWWGHPSNHHWKGWTFEGEGSNRCSLREGERCIWGGTYMTGESENADTR